MCLHGVEQLVIGQRCIIEAEFGIRCPFFTQRGTNRQAGASDQALEHVAARRGLQILDDFRLDAGIADHCGSLPAYCVKCRNLDCDRW
jgi:hypothetical protein